MRKTPVVIAATLAVTLGTGVAFAADGQRDLGRIAGSDRFATAVAISQEAFPDGARAVYLARADAFADALAGASLANNGPILLVPQCGTVPGSVIAEVNRLQPLKVQALGGPGAVCDAVIQQFAGSTSDAAPGSDALTFDGPGAGATDGFELGGGDYSIDYAFTGNCNYSVTLNSTRDDPFEFEIVAQGEGPFSGETNAFDLSNQEYFFDISANNSTDCPYSITITSS